MFRSISRRLLLVALAALCVPAAAAAQIEGTVMLDGNPLNIWAGPDGSVQVGVEGFLAGEWYSPGPITDPITGNQGPNPNPNAGFGLIVYNVETETQTTYGAYPGQDFPNPEGPTVAPGQINGAWTIATDSGATLRVEQTLLYQNGSRQLEGVWRITNQGGGTAHFRAGYLGDMAIRGSDSGVGFIQPGPPRFIGGVNPNVGGAGGLVEITPWSHFQVSRYSTASSNFSGTGFNDQIETQHVDNDMGVQWDTHGPGTAGLAPGQTAEFRLGQRYIDTLGLDPVRAVRQTGDQHVVNVKLADINGNPEPNAQLRWAVHGANPAEGALTTNAQGKARLSWIGGAPGDDVITVYRDSNGSGFPDFDETQAEANVAWEGPEAPIIGETFTARPEGGTVRVQLPRGTSATNAKALGFAPDAAEKFVPLTGAMSIPVGSKVDTRRGKIRLLSAGMPQRNNSSYNGASFKGSLFNTGQKSSNGLTTLTMRGPLRCKKPRARKGKIVTEARKRRRSRRLFGRGRGRFRTRGRRSSATVRGTAWLTKDTCRGTLTVVRQGSVSVKDVAKKKRIVLRAKGKRKRYLARVPKRLR